MGNTLNTPDAFTAGPGNAMPQKYFVSAQALLDDSIRLGFQILDSGFAPNFMVAVWRGGAPAGIAVQEILHLHGVATDHIAIRTSSYSGVGAQDIVRVHGLEYIVSNIAAGDRLLIVDDVFDSGRSMAAILEKLRHKCGDRMPGDVRIATVYYKPGHNLTDLAPDFFVRETDAWLVFPHELNDLTEHEISDGKGMDLAALRRTAKPGPQTS